jgi:hypothetical protein
MSYQVILPKSAQKELDRLPNQIEARILTALTGLETQPRPVGCKKKKNFAAKALGASASAIIGLSMKSTTKFCKSSLLPSAIGGKFIGEIQSQTVPEIAVSIMAQFIEKRAEMTANRAR